MISHLSWNGIPVRYVDTFPSDDEIRESNERAIAAVRASIAALEQEKAEVIALLSALLPPLALSEDRETIARAIALIEEVNYD